MGMLVTLRYTYRLRPGRNAVRALEREWSVCRWLWNQAVAVKRERRYWFKDTDLTKLRAEHPWLAAGSVVAQQQVLRTFRSDKRARRFKSARRDLPSVNYTRRGFSIKDGRLRLPRKVVAEFDQIAVEDFEPKFLAKSRTARKAADAAIGATKRELIEFAKRAGRELVLVTPAYSTMTCGCCGTRAKSRLPLEERTFRCDACGHVAMWLIVTGTLRG